MSETLGFFERMEQEDRELGGTIRPCPVVGLRKLRFMDRWKCSDGSWSNNWDDALEHEKSINVLARHRGALPEKLRIWITTDGKQFSEGDALSAAQAHQSNLDQQALSKQLAEAIWKCRPIGSEEELARLIDVSFPEIMTLLLPRMMPQG